MLGKNYELSELQSAVLAKELENDPVARILGQHPYHKQVQLVAMVLTTKFVKYLEQTPGYAAYFTELVLDWRRRRAEQTP